MPKKKKEAAPTRSEGQQPLVSIVVTAYNHLDYTRQCIDCLYKYTSHIPFELILVNNGSTDGTEEYFASIKDAKRITFEQNIGVDTAVNSGFAIASGRYTLNLSNDILVTHRWLDNLLACIESDPRIGMVVPVCNASSGYQQVNLGYRTIEEMHEKAAEFNKVSDPSKWEDRLRLITYTCLFPTALQKQLGGFDEDFNPGGFDDDAISFRIRRMGYRLVLAGDAFVHHFGSVTFSAEYTKSNLLERNRKLFFEKFGVDAWSVTSIDFNVLLLTDCSRKGHINILGVGESCGATLLQMKNYYRRQGQDDVELHYLAQKESQLPDLKTICQKAVCAPVGQLMTQFGNKQYDQIVVESETHMLENPPELFRQLKGLLAPGGQLIFTCTQIKTFLPILRALGVNQLSDLKLIGDYYFCYTNHQTS